jgi:hypothetical protein
MRKVDIHNHLGRNGDNPGFDKTIDIAYSRLGEGGVFGIANSDDFRYEKFVEQKGGKYNRVPVSDKKAVYVPERDMLVVKCQEMFTKQGDILAIAMPHGKEVKTKNTRDAIMEALDLRAILDAVHPFYVDGIGRFLEQNRTYLQFFSTWEIYNASPVFVPGVTTAFANKKAKNFYLSLIRWRNNIGMSASTDGHSAESIGKCYTMLDDFSLTSKNLPKELHREFRNVKSLDKLHRESNKWDALNHCKNMFLDKIGLMK